MAGFMNENALFYGAEEKWKKGQQELLCRNVRVNPRQILLAKKPFCIQIILLASILPFLGEKQNKFMG